MLGLVESNAGLALLRRRLTYLDPMAANRRYGTQHLQNVQRWLSDLDRDRGLRWNPAGWNMVVVDAPRQKNGFDCGVFICQYVRQLALGLPVTFSQRDIPGVRLRICSDLLDGECS